MTKSDTSIILHIGLPKTGTTYLQTTLLSKKKQLEEIGIVYPHAHKGNHILLAGEYSVAAGKPGPGDIRDRPEFVARARELVANSNAKTVVLSSEHMSFMVVSLEQIRALKTDLLSLGTIKSIVVYLRDQVEAFQSGLMTQMLLGRSIESLLAEFARFGAENIVWNYDALINTWNEGFEANVVVPRIVPLRRSGAFNIVDDFLRCIGLSEPTIASLSAASNAPGIDRNKSASEKALIIWDALKHGRVDVGATNEDKIRAALYEIDKSLASGPILPESAVEKVRASFAPTNELVRQRYFPDRKDLFEG